MFPLAALVAVAQAASDGEGHGEVVQNDSFHSCLYFDVGQLRGQQIEMEGTAGSGIQGSSAPYSLWPRWPEAKPGEKKCAWAA